MRLRATVTLAFLALAGPGMSATATLAADLPPVKATEKNKVPSCATPGRLMAFLKDRFAAPPGELNEPDAERSRDKNCHERGAKKTAKCLCRGRGDVGVIRNCAHQCGADHAVWKSEVNYLRRVEKHP